MNHYLVVVQAAGGYPQRVGPVEQAPVPPSPVIHSAVLVEDLRRYLDDAILLWRRLLDDAPQRAGLPASIEAFQALRATVVGDVLP